MEDATEASAHVSSNRARTKSSEYPRRAMRLDRRRAKCSKSSVGIERASLRARVRALTSSSTDAMARAIRSASRPFFFNSAEIIAADMGLAPVRELVHHRAKASSSSSEVSNNDETVDSTTWSGKRCVSRSLSSFTDRGRCESNLRAASFARSDNSYWLKANPGPRI